MTTKLSPRAQEIAARFKELYGIAPEIIVRGVLDWLADLGPVEVSTLGDRVETVEFRLPPELANVGLQRGVAAE